MKLRPKFDREFLSVTNGQNYVTYGKKILWNNKKIFPVNYMEMAVTYGEKSFMEQTPVENKCRLVSLYWATAPTPWPLTTRAMELFNLWR